MSGSPEIASVELEDIRDESYRWSFSLHEDGSVAVSTPNHDVIWITWEDWSRLVAVFQEESWQT